MTIATCSSLREVTHCCCVSSNRVMTVSAAHRQPRSCRGNCDPAETRRRRTTPEIAGFEYKNGRARDLNPGPHGPEPSW